MRRRAIPGARQLGLALVRCRQESRYLSPRALYRAWGKHLLRCDLKTYRRIEAGESVPSPQLFARLLEALSLTCNERTLGELARAYARVQFGEAALWAESVLSEATPNRPVPETVVLLTPAQWKALHADAACLPCFYALLEAPAEADRLCRLTGVQEAQGRRVLRRLARAGLVMEGASGVWNATVQGPIESLGDGDLLPERMRQQSERLLDLFKVFHCSASQAEGNLRLLTDELRGALTEASPRHDESRTAVLFELSLRRLMPDQ